MLTHSVSALDPCPRRRPVRVFAAAELHRYAGELRVASRGEGLGADAVVRLTARAARLDGAAVDAVREARS